MPPSRAAISALSGFVCAARAARPSEREETDRERRQHQEPRQRHPRPLAAREHRDALVHVVAAEEEGAEDPAHEALRLRRHQARHLLQGRAPAVQQVRVVLRVVGHAHVVPEAHLPVIGGELVRDDPQERRLAGAVAADDGDALAAVDAPMEAPVDDLVAEALAHALEAQDLSARARHLWEAEAHGPVRLARLHQLLAGEQLDPALHLPRLAGFEAEAVDEALGLGALRLLPGAAQLQVALLLRALDPVGLVVAGVAPQPLDLEGVDGADLAVEEVAVVADQQQRPLRATEEVVEPLQRRDVQVVGGLIEEQQVRPEQEQARERRAHLPAAGQLRDGPVELAGAEAQAREDLLGPVAAIARLEVGQQEVQVREPLRQLELGLGGGGGELGLDGLQVGEEPVAVPDEGLHRLDQRAGRQLQDVLRQVADARAAGAGQLALVGLALAGEDAQERRLAGAVGADEPDALARLDGEADLVEDELAAEGEGELVRGDERHGRSNVPRGPAPAGPAAWYHGPCVSCLARSRSVCCASAPGRGPSRPWCSSPSMGCGRIW